MIYLISTPNSLPDLITKFFTYRVGIVYIKGAKTYSDVDCSIEQCEAARYRSFEDILECAQTYFPETTEEDLLKLLLSIVIVEKENRYQVMCYNCQGILKPTCCFHQAFTDVILDEKFSEPYGSFKTHDLITWKHILRRIGISEESHLQQFKDNQIIVQI